MHLEDSIQADDHSTTHRGGDRSRISRLHPEWTRFWYRPERQAIQGSQCLQVFACWGRCWHTDEPGLTALRKYEGSCSRSVSSYVPPSLRRPRYTSDEGGTIPDSRKTIHHDRSVGTR